MAKTLHISHTKKGALPVRGVPFQAMKDAVLGKHYELSLVFVGDALSRKLNFQFRGKNKPTNILSFSLNKDAGEIFIHLGLVKKQAPKFNKTFPKFLGYLFIHGLLHLDGMEHGSRMEREEARFQKKFKC